MNAHQMLSHMPISRPLTERVVVEVFAALRSAEVAIVDLWKRRESSPSDARAYDSIAHLNEHTLKDIGAPNWLVARAADRREARSVRWAELDVR